MKIKHISIENFKSIEKLEYDFNGVTTALIGKNGRGKTAFKEAFYAGLTGDFPDNCIRNGTDQCSIKMTLEDGTTFERIQHRTKPNKVLIEGKATTAKTLNEMITTKTSLSKATEGIGKIADLSGLKAMTFGSAFASCKKIENVILPETLTLGSVDNQYLFSSCSSLKRVWMHGSEVPAEGTLDLTRTGLKTVCKDAFNGLPTKTKILMPESFVGVATYSYQIKEADACSRVFGADKEYTFVLQNANGLTNNATGAYGMVVFYKAIMDSSIASGHKDNLDHITIKLGDVSKSLAEWKAYYDALATE